MDINATLWPIEFTVIQNMIWHNRFWGLTWTRPTLKDHYLWLPFNRFEVWLKGNDSVVKKVDMLSHWTTEIQIQEMEMRNYQIISTIFAREWRINLQGSHPPLLHLSTAGQHLDNPLCILLRLAFITFSRTLVI